MFGNIFIRASLGVVFVAALSSVADFNGRKAHNAVGSWLPCALAEPQQPTTMKRATTTEHSATVGHATTTLPVTRAITRANLSIFPQITVTTDDKGTEVKYAGVPLRTVFAEMLPEYKLNSMPEWKALNRQELIVEVKGDDGFPGLVTALELAMNKSGDRYILATKRDSKDLESGVQLVCKMDEGRTRWVRQVVSVRIVSLAN